MAQLRVQRGAESWDMSLTAGREILFLIASAAPGGLHLVTQRPERYLAAFVHAGGHWVVLAPPTGADLTIDGVPVHSIKILDDQSALVANGCQLRLSESVEEVVGADSDVVRQQKKCPWCQQMFAVNASIIYCPTCGLAHHGKCLRDGRKCGSYPFCGYTVPSHEQSTVGALR
jgi:hypothetical protein